MQDEPNISPSTWRQIKKHDKANCRDSTWKIDRGDIIRKYSRSRSHKLLLEHARWIVLEKHALQSIRPQDQGIPRVYYICLCLSYDERLNSTSKRVGKTCTIPASMFEGYFWEKVVETGLSWEDEKCL